MELERHIQIRPKKKRRHVFAAGPAVVDGDRTRTWAELYDRCAQLGDALRKQGCGRGDVVQCMLDNTAEMVEAQQGVAMSGATLGSVNTRLDAATVAYVLEHSDARLFIADERYEATCREALATLQNPPPLVVVGGRADGYEALVASGDAAAPWTQPEDEWDALALNYTSGTVWKSNLRFTPSTRRLLDGVAMSVPHRWTEPARPRHRRFDLCTLQWLISTQVGDDRKTKGRRRAPPGRLRPGPLERDRLWGPAGRRRHALPLDAAHVPLYCSRVRKNRGDGVGGGVEVRDSITQATAGASRARSRPSAARTSASAT